MNEFWVFPQATFNNREIATGIWLLFAFFLCLFLKDIRSSMWDILKTTMQRKLILLFGSLAVNIAGLCWFFSCFGLWTSEQFASTILWFFLSGLVLTGRTFSVKEDENYFKNLLWDSIKVAGIFEFVIVAYTFSLLTELMLVPFMTFIGVIITVASHNEEHATVKVLFEWIAFAVVVMFLWHSVGSIWEQPELFFTTLTGRNFLLPGLLTVGSIPFFYACYCYSHIELARIQINLKTFQSDALKRYAQKRFFFTYIVRPWLLKRATRQFHLLPASTNSDVDQIIEDILYYERHSKYPPEVDENLGWCSYLARDFLKAEGLRTDDFHSGYDGVKWYAKSNSVDLDDQILPNRVAFYIEGTRGLVTTLKLKGHFCDDYNPTIAKEKFNEIAKILVQRSISGNLHRILDSIWLVENFPMTVDETRVIREIERYPDGNFFEVHFILLRGIEPAS